MFREGLDALGHQVDLAILSHIDSVPGIIYPIDKIVPLLKVKGVDVVAIDGAHAVGQVPIDLRLLERLGVDFYTSNCHKWLYCPSG
jgi:selenocysteine lyase/cysteine desulfurase